MRHRKSSSTRDIYSDKSLLRKKRKKTNRKHKLIRKKKRKGGGDLKVSRRKEIIKMNAEINKIETKNMQNINGTKNCILKR